MDDLSSARALAYDMVYNGVEVTHFILTSAKFKAFFYNNFKTIKCGIAYLCGVRLVEEA